MVLLFFQKYEKQFFWRNFSNFQLLQLPELTPVNASTYHQVKIIFNEFEYFKCGLLWENINRIIAKTTLKTFCKEGDFIAEEVEICFGDDINVPYGRVDAMILSCIDIPPIC